jgi:hypothetical protein
MVECLHLSGVYAWEGNEKQNKMNFAVIAFASSSSS